MNKCFFVNTQPIPFRLAVLSLALIGCGLGTPNSAMAELNADQKMQPIVITATRSEK